MSGWKLHVYSNKRKTSTNLSESSGRSPGWLGLEKMPCKQRLGELGLLWRKKRKFYGCLVAPFQCLIRRLLNKGANIFMELHGNKKKRGVALESSWGPSQPELYHSSVTLGGSSRSGTRSRKKG